MTDHKELTNILTTDVHCTSVYSLPIHFCVNLSQPRERRFIVAPQTVVAVQQCVVLLHYLVQEILPIPVHKATMMERLVDERNESLVTEHRVLESKKYFPYLSTQGNTDGAISR